MVTTGKRIGQVAVTGDQQCVDQPAGQSGQLPLGPLAVGAGRTEHQVVAVLVQHVLDLFDDFGIERAGDGRHDQSHRHRRTGRQRARHQIGLVAQVGDRRPHPRCRVRAHRRPAGDHVRHGLLGDSGPGGHVLHRHHR
jgi:hypothetical protein